MSALFTLCIWESHCVPSHSKVKIKKIRGRECRWSYSPASVSYWFFTTHLDLHLLSARTVIPKHLDSPSPFHDKEEPLRKKRLHTSLYKGVDLMYLWESPPTNQLHIYGIHYKSSISTPKQVRSQLFSTPPTPRGEDFSGRLQLKGNEKKEKQQRKARLQSS